MIEILICLVLGVTISYFSYKRGYKKGYDDGLFSATGQCFMEEKCITRKFKRIG